MEESFSRFKKTTTIGYSLCVLGVASFFVASFSSVPYFIGILGVIALIIGLVIIFRSSQSRRNWLIKNGKLIKCKIDYILLELTATGSASIKKPLESYSLGRLHMYKLGCKPINAKEGTDIYTSSMLAGLPKVIPGSEIDVYVDHANPKTNYWVDISKVNVDLSIRASSSQLFDKFGQQSGFYRSYDGVNFEKAETAQVAKVGFE